MIEVLALTESGEPKTYTFRSTAVEIIEGTLVVYKSDQSGFLAGFAPGQWARFRLLTEAGNPVG